MSRPRIRYIKPEIWLSRDFRALTPIGRLTFMALISNADDDGRLKTDPGHLALTYLPGCEPYEIATQLEAMEERRMVMTYVVRGVHYLAVTGWSAHQRVSHYVKSDLPEPPKFKRRADNGAQLVLKTSSTGSQNKETGTANKRQSELDSLRRPMEQVSSPARPRSSANGLVPSSSTVSSPTRSTELSLLSDSGIALAPVEQIFEAWRQATGHARAAFDDKRRRICSARLKEGWTEEELILVVTDGWQNDPWNERPLHNQFEVLLRDAAHVEKFLKLAREGAPVLAARKSNLELSIEQDLAEAARLRAEGR